MDITIKMIRGIAATNLIILSLAGCSSTPAPWTKVDDSPWGAKHAAEEQNLPFDDVVILDTSLNDPVLLGEPEPEPIIMLEPVQEVIMPVVVEEQTPEQEIMALSGASYAVQVYASNTAENIEKFRYSKNLAELKIVKTYRSGGIVYVLVDIYPDRSSAKAAAASLEIKTGSKPWVRSVVGLQKIVAL